MGFGFRRTPLPCNSGIVGVREDPNIVLVIPYYWAGGPHQAYHGKDHWVAVKLRSFY